MLNKTGKNGSLPLFFGAKGAWRRIWIDGGPFDACPQDGFTYRVCVRAEGEVNCDVRVPIRDFDIPKDDAAVGRAIVAAFEAAFKGRPVYVGCMGGWGRTGLFLALMAKVAGHNDPVDFVREQYTARAVETAMQEEYVAKFDVSELQKRVFTAAWKSRFFLL